MKYWLSPRHGFDGMHCDYGMDAAFKKLPRVFCFSYHFPCHLKPMPSYKCTVLEEMMVECNGRCLHDQPSDLLWKSSETTKEQGKQACYRLFIYSLFLFTFCKKSQIQLLSC